MYKSPIEVYIEQAVQNIEEQRDNQIYSYISEKFHIDVDRDELVKALNYDRKQYDKGYKEGIQDFIEAITNYAFIRDNYGEKDINAYMVHAFKETMLEDYKEWKKDNE